MIFFSRLKVGYPDPLRSPPDWGGEWKVYTICETNQPKSCTTRRDVREMERADQERARQLFVNFLNRANTGQPISTLYDEKQCHEAHSFKLREHDQSAIKILRVRAGHVRLYFIYLPNRRIVIVKVKPKRKDKLSEEERIELEEKVRKIFFCLEENDFDSKVIKT